MNDYVRIMRIRDRRQLIRVSVMAVFWIVAALSFVYLVFVQ